MKPTRSITAEQSGAFVETFELAPTADGPLAGLSFAVKDLIDVADRLTGCGNPTWRDTHPPAAVHAVCVEQLLAAGAHAVGKTVTDELAFSLIGENHFYGTPLNAAAPNRVPGGSSSGSASAVACGLADFALGTDTGGSVRVPASNCGIWGLRTSHGFVSVAGVMPFAPTFDTVGILARSAEVLRRAAEVLLADKATEQRVRDDLPAGRRVRAGRSGSSPGAGSADRAVAGFVRPARANHFARTNLRRRARQPVGDVARHLLRAAMERNPQFAGRLDRGRAAAVRAGDREKFQTGA